ncbi:serine-threonine protein phosphatase [Rhizoctonia solani 123E]|uniref:Serine-threonine protein phosphatase n=1 Tax=Rhizoctonia solani 123E TaxID=1423351 RepID=A0A074S279_9AGAM|nr:serine-threonine protein phosphatase [Rhizoctonia solani 123E]
MAPSPRTIVLGSLSVLSLYALLHLPSSTPEPSPQAPLPNGQFTRRIVAIGDLHGDLVNMKKVLSMAGVINEDGNWSRNVDFLVQTGDMVDRGDDTLEMYALMDKLREQALHAGGQVLSHLGNHEVMNSIGDWRYVYPSEIATFGSVSDRQQMISSGWVGKSWRANYTITSRLPLHPSLGPPNTDYNPKTPPNPLSHAALSFVHGGLSPTYSNLTPYPSAINALGKSLLRRLQDRVQPPPHPPNPYPGLPDSSTQAEHELYGADGPLWYRGWATEPDSFVCPAVEGVLAKTGVRRLIMGHTPDFERQVSRCDGKIIIIDTGISKAYGGVLSALSITYTLTPHTPSRFLAASNERAWTEHEVIKAIYPDKAEVFVDSKREIRGSW